MFSMDVIIVSRTRMKADRICVGGILENKRSVRLLDARGRHYLGSESPLDIGQVYAIEFRNHPRVKPPHIEDILVSSIRFRHAVRNDANLAYFLERSLKIWRGSPTVLFDGKLNWTAYGSAYLKRAGSMPSGSLGFWVPASDLILYCYGGKVRYVLEGTTKNMRFVGFQDAVKRIPSGTLVRVSLARWWKSPGTAEERCCLQLSAWYGLAGPQEHGDCNRAG